MRNLQLLLAGAVTAAAVTIAPAANAATVVQTLGAGSSAIFNTASLGAYNLAGAGALHYTTKGSSPCVTNKYCAQLNDVRSASILPEGGNLSVVWTADQSKVWAYLSVDSTVGNRAFFAVPRAQLQLDPETEVGNSQQLISTTLWGADQTALPPAIYTALNNTPITTGFTDIRPEDAKFAESRITSALDTTTYDGLGYGTGPNTLIGTPVLSAFSSSQANPVDFNIMGTDPFTSQPVTAFATISIGAAPIVVVINRSNASGLGAPGVQNTTATQLRAVFEGSPCNSKELTGLTSNNVPLNVVLREPLSGTMNTFEFTNIRLKNFPDDTQEKGINPALPNNNPLELNCTAGGAGTGMRKRAIGTGEVIKNGVMPVADSVGYAFFSYGNVAPIAGSPSYGYLTLNSVDPIFASYSNGQLPVCANPCPAAPNTTFPNLRNGSYRSWSVLRAVTDGQGVNITNYTNTNTLITAIQNNVNSTVPDFVPFNAVAGDKGLLLYRSHYFQSGVAPNNGLSGQKESGGDVGGCIERRGPAPGVLNCHQ